MRHRHPALLILLVAVLLIVGCRQPQPPKRFANGMAKTNEMLSLYAKTYYKAIEPLSKGNAPNMKTAQAAYDEMGNTLARATKEYDAMIPPLNSPPGEELLAKYREFLIVQQKIMDECITPIHKAAQDPKLNAGAKWAVIAPLMSRAAKDEEVATKEMEEPKAKYYKHHILEPK